MSLKIRETTEAERVEILTWHQAGKSLCQIKAIVKKPQTTIYDIIKRAQERPDNPVATAKRSGRPPKLSATAERKLVRHATTHTQDTLAMLTIPSKSGSQFSKPTVRKVLKTVGVH